MDSIYVIQEGEKNLHLIFPLVFACKHLSLYGVCASINNALSNSCMLGNTLNFKASYNRWIKETTIKSEHTSSRNSFQVKLYVFFSFRNAGIKISKSN